jgi:hypothetical protein
MSKYYNAVEDEDLPALVGLGEDLPEDLPEDQIEDFSSFSVPDAAESSPQDALLASLREQQQAQLALERERIALETQRLNRELEAAKASAAQASQQAKQAERDAFLKGFDLNFPEEDVTLTKEEQAAFAQVQPGIRKMILAAQKEAFSRLSPQLQHLAKKQMELHDQYTSQPAAPVTPHIDTLIQAQYPEAVAVVNDPQFAAYKAKGSAVPGMSNGDLLQAAYQNQNAAAFVALLKDFKDGAARPSLSKQGGAAARSTPASGKYLRRSDYDAKLRQYQLGKMDSATFDKIDAAFQNALIAGRVID